MPENEPLVKKTIRLFSGDTERLDEYYPKVGHNRAIRALVRRHLTALDAKVNQRSPDTDELSDLTS